MKVAIIGECMLEISNAAAGVMSRGMPCVFNFGGDTLNTAIYMSRLGSSVSYFTGLGDDPYSQWLMGEWSAEGIDTSSVVEIPGAMPGMYMIQTDSMGERSFSYWRDNSAARQWLNDLTALSKLMEHLKAFDMVYLSGITLSLMSEGFFIGCMAGLAELRTSGTKIVFDINYRPKGWASKEAARHRINEMLEVTDIALPTWDDEILLFGDASPEQTAKRYLERGVKECVIKLGAQGALCIENAQHQLVPTIPCEMVVDSTGAGDSFNGAYLSRRLEGCSVPEACAKAHGLAGIVIQHRGAIIDTTHMLEAIHGS